jgi:hypothetical protein
MSATPAQIQAVYDFENIMATATESVLVANGLIAATQATITKLQKPRPRVEVLFRTGSEEIPRRIVTIPEAGKNLNGAYKGQLSLAIVTDASEAAKTVHSQYLTKCRWVMADLANELNLLATFDKHAIHFVRETGTSMSHKNEDGYWVTTMTFDVDFSIERDALVNLATA